MQPMCAQCFPFWPLFNLTLLAAAGAALGWGAAPAASAAVTVALGLAGALIGVGIARWARTPRRR